MFASLQRSCYESDHVTRPERRPQEISMTARLVAFFAFLVAMSSPATPFAAEAKDKLIEAGRKEGKIVIAIPPAAELRKGMEIIL
jgi:hypothetical protein